MLLFLDIVYFVCDVVYGIFGIFLNKLNFVNIELCVCKSLISYL